uniref:Uncharacterized protein n=1 Tax=Candidatus Kentrum sp. FW TaxID=2126338 RepID=A0A450T4L5_9GAMM|nr:MAG: hypothetical protein BECKFW1821B_GA0114236_106615 [Candidatus Kentron sp. FW]
MARLRNLCATFYIFMVFGYVVLAPRGIGGCDPDRMAGAVGCPVWALFKGVRVVDVPGVLIHPCNPWLLLRGIGVLVEKTADHPLVMGVVTGCLPLEELARLCLGPMNHSAVDECGRNPGHGRERPLWHSALLVFHKRPERYGGRSLQETAWYRGHGTIRAGMSNAEEELHSLIRRWRGQRVCVRIP